MTDERALLQATLATQIAPDARIVSVQQRDGAQGYSGATLRYYDVDYALADGIAQVRLVTKPAPLIERRTAVWLTQHDAAVPFCHAPDLTADGLAALCMQYVGETAPEQKQQAAQALASVHHAAMDRADELAWLPRADVAFAEQWLNEKCWRGPWQRVLAGEGYSDARGHNYGPIKPGGDFAAEFAAYTQPLEDTAARFVEAINELWAQGDALTLIHSDFHGDHALEHGGRSYIIDWGFVHYGPLYLDLPNYFSRDEALLYRDALAELEHNIPRDTFLAGYDAVSAYPGFKYFTIGLWNWCYGDPPHRRESVMHFIDMVLHN